MYRRKTLTGSPDPTRATGPIKNTCTRGTIGIGFFWWIFYQPPKKFHEDNIFSCVCLLSVSLVNKGWILCGHYPWYIRPDHTGPPWPYPVRPPVQEVIQSCCRLLNFDITVQGYPHAQNLFNVVLTVQPPTKPVQTCSLWSTYGWQVGSWYPTGMLFINLPNISSSYSREENILPDSLLTEKKSHLTPSDWQFELKALRSNTNWHVQLYASFFFSANIKYERFPTSRISL